MLKKSPSTAQPPVTAEEWQGESLEVEINGAAEIDMHQVDLAVLVVRLDGGADCSMSGSAQM